MEEDLMQDDKPVPLDPNATPPSHDETNQPGMTNGVPDAVNDAQPKARPPGNNRKESEAGPATTGSGTDS
jgi:hypothetical protein